MVNKLLKYDLKYMIKRMSIFYILALFFSITTRILFSLKQTLIVDIFGQVSVGCMFSMTGSILFNTVIRTWVRFKDSLYKDEAYLTHTLPVTKTEIYESKFLESVILSIVSLIVVVFSIFITYYTPEKWLAFKDMINLLVKNFDLNITFLILSVILIFFLEVLNAIQIGFLGIILGNRHNNSKMGFSFLYGFISYILSQGVVVFLIFIIGLFNSDIMSIFYSTSLINNSVLKILICIAIVVYSLIIFVMNIICTKSLEKGVNVE